MTKKKRKPTKEEEKIIREFARRWLRINLRQLGFTKLAGVQEETTSAITSLNSLSNLLQTTYDKKQAKPTNSK